MSDNQNYNDDINEEIKDTQDYNKLKPIRIVALVTALFLVIMFIAPIFINLNLPSLNFLKESYKLNQKPEVKKFKKSIATINAGSKKGTGFNIDKKGLIVTNAHIVKDENNVFVDFYKGKRYKGTVWRIYSDIDLALIKIYDEELPALELGEDINMKKGDEVLIIGNPLNFNGVANKGSFYEVAKLKKINKPILLIKAPINRGNSGSPVFNKNGKVIGVIFATINNESKNEKLGAAIPINYLKNKMKNYENN